MRELRIGFVATAIASIGLLGTAVEEAQASTFTINAASCTYANNSGAGFSGEVLDVVGYSYSSYWRVGVRGPSSEIGTYYMYCPVEVPNGSSFEGISLVGYDYSSRYVRAILYETPVHSQYGTSTPIGSITSSSASTVQKWDACFSSALTTDDAHSYMIEISFGGSSGAACYAFDIQLFSVCLI